MRLLIFGAGGHAKVVLDAAKLAGHDIAGVVDDDPSRTDLLSHTVHRTFDGVSFDGFIVAIGDNSARERVFADLVARGFAPATVVHPASVIAEGAVLGPGTFVAAGAIVNPDARVGTNTILNTGCVVEHDVVVGDHAHVGPGANICGKAAVGDRALIGVGTCLKPGVRVGAGSVCGAGSAVVSDMPEASICAGVPARVIRMTSGGTE